VIAVEGLSVGYAGKPVLGDVTFAVPEGDLVLVVGRTGAGKSTLLRAVRDAVDGARLVPQDPLAALTGGTVESQLGASGRRLEELLDLFGLSGLRDRPVSTLSGGQQQRVAIAAALAARPGVLVLDEPTSALDPVAAEEVLATLHRLAHDVGTTLLVAEHRLERVVHHADSVLVVTDGKVVGPREPAEAMTDSPVRPPLVDLGRALGWAPLPLSVRQARRVGADLRTRLADAVAPEAPGPAKQVGQVGQVTHITATARRLGVLRGDVVALRGVDLELRAGEAVALMGRNGSGKSTLLAAVAGAVAATHGRVAASVPVVLAPQDPEPVLSGRTVGEQLALSGSPTVAGPLLERLAGRLAQHQPVTNLSQGQRMSLALATRLAPVLDDSSDPSGSPRPTVILLDEPTRGLDYDAKAALSDIVRQLAAAGHTLVVATHDVELAATLATRVVVLAEGEVVTDGPARQVLADSPAFAPQVAKVVHPAAYLTTGEVLAALGR
jgi:energy-coupling factor transport system ATP-binding protein